MIDFDFEKEFPQDFEVPINIASLDKRIQKNTEDWCGLMAEHFRLFAEAYVHAGDIIFYDYMSFLSDEKRRKEMPSYEINMFGVIYRLYHHALEMALKSLMYNVNIQPQKEHHFSEFINIIRNNYDVSGKMQQYFDYIEKFDKYSNGSQTGRYPTDTKGNVIGRTDNGYIVLGGNDGGIATMVFHIHEIFTELFPNLKIKEGGN